MTSVCSYSSTKHSGYMDYSFSRHANSAGMALPRIPRRTSATSTRPVSFTQSSLPTSPPTPTSAKVIVQPPTPPDASRKVSPSIASTSQARSSDASSGSGSDTLEMLAPKSRRSRSYQRGMLPSSMRPPEQSTPTPATLKGAMEKRVPFPASSSQENTPRASMPILAPKPRPGISPLVTSVSSDAVPSRAASVTVGAMIRKKSGEPLKSSLKSRRPVVRGDLSVVTAPMGSKSEPTTPTGGIKSVHFDSQLEHVKLFLAEQKPLAVSRDGSPTDDTSGTESDFPAFIYGKDEKEDKGQLELVADGVRVESAEEREKADVKLESLQLGEDGNSLVGRVRVRNLAFEKWVAVRFTCDWWQTTSEVTARYLDTIPDTNGQHDRFQFSIRLNDMINRIDEKTMFLAVRYASAGREMWDNNGGQNYKVTFARRKVQASPKSEESGRAAGIAALKSKLEKVAQADENRSTVGGFLSSRGQRSQSLSPPVAGTASSPKPVAEEGKATSFTLKSNTSLSSRYDFGASLRDNFRRTTSLDSPAADHARTKSHPATYPNFPRRSPTDKRTLVELTRGSPRIVDADDTNTPTMKTFFASSELEDTPVPALSRRNSRNHQRGYFDLGVSSTSHAATGPMWRVSSGGSEDSTPSSASNEESSRDSSPNTSPYEGPINLVPEESFPRSPSPGEDSNYSAFLDKFCFFTGAESLSDFSEMHRSHSASSVEEFLSTSPYLGSDYLSPGQTPTRSSSYDDVATISGDATPTARSIAAGAPSVFASPPSVVGFAH
ncbi:putative phosphatase regulatory subunit-domain-containing protein [Irpex lacteus]|nr:putative phosphatase regulatory subunit-domain-containing protein [Irpex lacteus]